MTETRAMYQGRTATQQIEDLREYLADREADLEFEHAGRMKAERECEQLRAEVQESEDDFLVMARRCMQLQGDVEDLQLHVAALEEALRNVKAALYGDALEVLEEV